MAARGTAAKSASGAAMSKYDVEVEKRLKALEEIAHSKCDGGGGGSDVEGVAALEAKVDRLIEILNESRYVTDCCPKGVDGIRRITL